MTTYSIEIPEVYSPALHRAFLYGWISAYLRRNKRRATGYSRRSHLVAWLGGYRSGQAFLRAEAAAARKARESR